MGEGEGAVVYFVFFNAQKERLFYDEWKVTRLLLTHYTFFDTFCIEN